jgi:hypothetical protein
MVGSLKEVLLTETPEGRVNGRVVGREKDVTKMCHKYLVTV